jgi:hypothetical protein
MTTVTKTPQAILAPTPGAAGTTKGTPGADSGWIDLGGADGGDLMVSILNGASAPGVGGTLLIQASAYANGASPADYQPLGGDTNAYSSSTGAGLTSATIWIDPGVRAIRVIGYGNTTNPVTFGAVFSGITRA